jgi:hypothetical protein
MIRNRAAALLAAALVAILASGCASSSDRVATAGDTERTSTTTADPRAQLLTAVREAIRRDHAESVRSLWTNRVPAHPIATAGPALRAWRQSVTDRRRAGIRVRTLSQRLRILSIRLDPSYETATALIQNDQRVQLVRADGRPSGGPRIGQERVRLVLHRRPGDQFVIWRVEVIRR